MAQRETELRHRAEARLRARGVEETPRSEPELRRLLFELEVHQSELEIQNEELRASREEAQQAAARYTELHDFAPMGYVTLAEDGTIRAVNLAAARLLRVERSRLLGVRFRGLVSAASCSGFDDLFEKALTLDACETVAREVELRGEGQDRALRGPPPPASAADRQRLDEREERGPPFVRLTAAPLRGSPREVLLAMEDVSARARAEAALREANARLVEADRRKDEFLAVLSHELRNPLSPIRSSIYVLARVPADSPQATSAREIIQRQTDHLARLVGDLLDTTRIQRGKIALDRARIDLREVVARTCEDHRAAFEEARVELRQELTDGPVWIDADVTRISQVLGNLLQNAVKFTPASGIVTVEVAVRGGTAELSVRDTGVGMRPEDLGHVFEPFAQADQGLSRSRGGLGLGLALSRSLVELHGGSIHAQSQGQDRGSEFWVDLPLAPPPAAEATDGEGTAPAGGRLVLVVEDNVDACESLAAALALGGHRVHAAHDGMTGVAAAYALRPDVVLCDIGLPDIDGYEVARRLRADEAFRSTRLVALSGYARPEDRERSRAAGFDAHVAKPPDLSELEHELARGARAPRDLDT